jgi:hypothetical protein
MSTVTGACCRKAAICDRRSCRRAQQGKYGPLIRLPGFATGADRLIDFATSQGTCRSLDIISILSSRGVSLERHDGKKRRERNEIQAIEFAQRPTADNTAGDEGPVYCPFLERRQNPGLECVCPEQPLSPPFSTYCGSNAGDAGRDRKDFGAGGRSRGAASEPDKSDAWENRKATPSDAESSAEEAVVRFGRQRIISVHSGRYERFGEICGSGSTGPEFATVVL